MQIARVIGTTVATIKDQNLVGQKLLIVRPTDEAGEAYGKPFVAVDTLDAGIGDLVLTASGSSARQTEITKTDRLMRLLWQLSTRWKWMEKLLSGNLESRTINGSR